jgi:hypothetical protein
MAAADYRLCDVCDGKAFYDSNLGYEWGPDEYRPDSAPYRVAGEEQYDDQAMNQRSGMRLGYLGDWAVLCESCAKTHRTAILPIDASAAPTVTIMGDGAVEERIKTLMAGIGMPNSTSLYTAMKQLQNEIEQGIKIVPPGVQP